MYLWSSRVGHWWTALIRVTKPNKGWRLGRGGRLGFMTSTRDARKWLLMRRQRGPGSLGGEHAGPIVDAAAGVEETTEDARYLEINQRQSLRACIEGVFACT